MFILGTQPAHNSAEGLFRSATFPYIASFIISRGKRPPHTQIDFAIQMG